MDNLAALMLWLVLANMGAFLLMLWDKRAAIGRRRRVSEWTLILSSLIGGSAGALAAAILLRHKTRKQPIAAILRIMPLAHVGLALFVIAQWGR